MTSNNSLLQEKSPAGDFSMELSWRNNMSIKKLKQEEEPSSHSMSIDQVKLLLDGILGRTEEIFSNGQNSSTVQEELRWIMQKNKKGISFDLCCSALNKQPEEERVRLLNLYEKKHGNNFKMTEH